MYDLNCILFIIFRLDALDMNIINFILILSSLLLLTRVFGRNDLYFITAPNVLMIETPHVFNVHTSTDLIISIETVHKPSKIRHQGPVYVVKKGHQSIPYYFPFVGDQGGSKIQLNFKGDICSNLENCKSSKVVDGSFINKTYELGLIDKNFIIFAETDKPIYKPGEKVKFRFMPIYPTNLMREPASVGKTWEIVLNSDGKYKSIEVHDKKTAQEFDLIIIENPDGVRVAQWRNVNIEKSMNLEYQLTNDPVFGIWKSKAVFKGQEEVMEFTVKKYVLPRFVVEVSPPDEILASDNEIKFKVCAKHSTGKAMKAKIRGTSCLEKRCQMFQSNLNSVDCSKIFLKENLTKIPDNTKFVINVTVTENESTYSVSKNVEGSSIMYTPYEIKFESQTYFKPGLPYFGKLKLVRHNGKSQQKTNMQISVSGDYRNSWGFQANYTSDELGMIDFIIPYIPAHFPIEIRIKGDGSKIFI